MVIAVGSENPVKLEAVKNAFTKVWPSKKFEFIGVKVSSGVPDQPMCDEESITGARNRAKAALKETDADFGIGLEGGLQKIGKHWYDDGWMVIIDKKGNEGIGSTAKIMVPPPLMNLIHKGTELGVANDIIFKTKNSKHAGGHFGLMTNHAISRMEGYRDGVIMALVRFVHPELFS